MNTTIDEKKITVGMVLVQWGITAVCALAIFIAALSLLVSMLDLGDSPDSLYKYRMSNGDYAGLYWTYDFELTHSTVIGKEWHLPYEEFCEFYDNYLDFRLDMIGDGSESDKYLNNMKNICDESKYISNISHYDYLIDMCEKMKNE